MSYIKKCQYCGTEEPRNGDSKITVCFTCKKRKLLIIRAKDANCGIKECTKCHEDFLDTKVNFNNSDHCRKCRGK